MTSSERHYHLHTKSVEQGLTRLERCGDEPEAPHYSGKEP